MKLFQKTRDESGTEIAEAALVLPIVFLVMFAIFWFGRAFNVSSTLARAAKEGALAASLSSCVTCGNTPNSNQKIADAVESVLAADKLNAAGLQSYTPPFICTPTVNPSCTTSATASNATVLTMQICTGVPLTCGTGGPSGCGSNSPPACGTNPVYGTRVSLAYAFDWAHFSYDASTNRLSKLPTLTLSASAQTVPEN
jgi:Flp pilus assembly protein TadG